MNEKNFAVIGHPIGHTMSPFIHTKLFELSNIDANYTVIDVENLEDDIETLKKLDGFNITMPHKRGIINFLSLIDSKAEIMDSVNTVKNTDKGLEGYSTDGVGCVGALFQYGGNYKGKVLLLGNGGAARAIAFEILQHVEELKIVVRTKEKGESIKKDLKKLRKDVIINVITYEMEENSQDNYDLLINTTSVGMHPNVGISPVSSNIIKRCDSVFDAVYNPKETELLKIAKECSKNTIGGMEMLVYQAVAAHEIWYGGKFQAHDIKQLCYDATQEMETIFK